MAENPETTNFMDMDMNIDKTCITQYVDQGSVESHRFYLARKTLFELLKDRGYGVPNTELNRSLTEFRSEFGDKPNHLSLSIRAPLLSNPSSQILVIFCGTEEIKKSNILTIFSQIVDQERLHQIILVLQSKMNHFARKIVDTYPIKIEIFQITDLLINITKHVLSPKHKMLTIEEKQTLLQKYQLKDQQMPRMLENDTIARYYGLEKGQVVKLSYSGEMTTSLVTYRCVM